MSDASDTQTVVAHEVECPCPVETFVGKAVDCFDHRACKCLNNCRRVETTSHPWHDRPDQE